MTSPGTHNGTTLSVKDERRRASAPPQLNLTLAETVPVWAKIGLLSFGGPAGQISLMHRIVVEEKSWISNTRFLHALNFCMILPGPEAQQLATYVGWLLHGLRGGLIAGTLFVAPGFVVILALSYLYVSAGGMTVVQGLFLGFKAAVVAIVLQALVRIGRRSLTTTPLTGIAASAFIAAFAFGVPFPLIVAGAAAIGFATANLKSSQPTSDKATTQPGVERIARDPQALRSDVTRGLSMTAAFVVLWLGPVAILASTVGPTNVFTSIGLFFSKMAVVTFGGAYAVLSYVAQEAVRVHGWLTPSEMIDGLALAETTPGPLIQVVQFVGFMAAYRNPGVMSPSFAALLASAFTTWVTFVPCFLWVFLGAPHMERLRQNKFLVGAFSAVTAAVVGVIANLAVWFSIHSLFAKTTEWRAAGLVIEIPVPSSIELGIGLMTAIALALVFRFRASVLVTLATTGLLGMAVSLW